MPKRRSVANFLRRIEKLDLQPLSAPLERCSISFCSHLPTIVVTGIGQREAVHQDSAHIRSSPPYRDDIVQLSDIDLTGDVADDYVSQGRFV